MPAGPPQSGITQPPLHGYRGAMTPPPPAQRPRGFTVAISREAGSRGGTIAAAVGHILGWQVFTQEMLDFLAHDESARSEVLEDLPPASREWAELELTRATRGRELASRSDAVAVARLVFALAARGEVVVVGRGAGFLLPPESTVHVRVVAPLSQRVAYMGQWLRLTESESAAEVTRRDRKRNELLATLSNRDVADPTAYDLVVNAGRLGIAACAELIAQAVRAKQLPADGPSGDESS